VRDPVDEGTRAMAREALAGWRVRLASVRTDKLVAPGSIHCPTTWNC
jgi:hypothetical protein